VTWPSSWCQTRRHFTSIILRVCVCHRPSRDRINPRQRRRPHRVAGPTHRMAPAARVSCRSIRHAPAGQVVDVRSNAPTAIDNRISVEWLKGLVFCARPYIVTNEGRCQHPER